MTDQNENKTIGTKGVEWTLNAQNKETTSGDEKLTRAVQQVIDVDDTDRDAVLAEHFPPESLEGQAVKVVVELYGADPLKRVQAIAYMDGRPVLLGDCPCKGEKCRAAWGAVWNTRDLDMVGHRGSMKTTPCPSMPATEFDPATGKFLRPVPLGMNPDEWYRYERAHWGDANKADLANFMNANVASAENNKGYHAGDWVVDE